MAFVPSRYNIAIVLRSGGALVYNALRGNFLRIDPPEARALAELAAGRSEGVAPDVVEQLELDGLVVRDDVDELRRVQDLYEAQRFDRHAMTLTIAPTMACNFGCDYCFQGHDKPSETMSLRVQDAIVDHVDRAGQQGVRSLGVAWYGGEPLLRRNVIEALSQRLIAVCDRYRMSYAAMIVTNAYKLDRDAARALQRCRVESVQVTLDGTPEYHDNRRHLLGGQGTFGRILGNLRDIVDTVPLRYVVRVNIDGRNHKDIARLIDTMAEMGLGHRPNLAMYFAPVEALTEGCHAVSDVTLGKAAYGALETELYRRGYRAGLVPLPYPPRFHGTCAAVKPRGLVILPGGDVHKCWDTVSWPDKKSGLILEPERLEHDAMFQRWLAWTPFDNQTCRSCKLLPSCAGACAYKFLHAEDTRGEAAVLPCPSWKYNIKERLVWRAIALGAVSASDIDPAAAATIPSELCADDAVAGGKPLPAAMQAAYDRQREPPRHHLPVVRS